MKGNVVFVAIISCTIMSNTLLSSEYDILIAAENNNVALAEKCIEKYGVGLLRKKRFDGSNLLHITSFRYGTAFAQFCIDKGGRDLLKEKDLCGDTPLHDAVCAESRDHVELFLKNGAGMHVENKQGITPYCLSFSLKAYDVRLLLCNTLAANNKLLMGLKNVNLKEVVSALDSGAQIDIQDGAGKTVLHHAVLKNNLKFVRELLSRGADPTIKDRNREAPMEFALGAGNEMISLFVQATHAKSERK